MAEGRRPTYHPIDGILHMYMYMYSSAVQSGLGWSPNMSNLPIGPPSGDGVVYSVVTE
jgi:hypothetical protein